jgi:putative membrane protein
MRIFLIVAVMVLLAGPWVAPASGQAPTSQAPADKARRGAKDQKFISKAAEGDLAEIELGKLAAEKASSDGVKQLGQRLAQDHSRANDELTQLAQQKGVALPTALDRKHTALRDRLAKLSGAEFDRAYLTEMNRDHREDIAEFEREAQKGGDPDVKSWAAKTLPTLREHLELVQKLRAQAGSGTKAR